MVFIIAEGIALSSFMYMLIGSSKTRSRTYGVNFRVVNAVTSFHAHFQSFVAVP